MPNFAHLQASYLKITPENEHLLRCVFVFAVVCDGPSRRSTDPPVPSPTIPTPWRAQTNLLPSDHMCISCLQTKQKQIQPHSTRYDANSPGDLPVLTRYFPAEAVRHLTPKAKFL